MRKRIKFDVEIGDANYVKPGEYFAELSADGSTIIALKKRRADLILETVASTPVATETKTVTIDLANVDSGDTVEVTPTSGKTLSKVTINITDTTSAS